MLVREAQSADLDTVLALYSHLQGDAPPARTPALEHLWASILAQPGRHVILAEREGCAAAACELVVLPNLTHSQRPYGLIENVVTHPAHRQKGCALAVLRHAQALAEAAGCYKLMLLSGEKHPGARPLYEKAGFNRRDKTAYVQWLPAPPQ